MISPGRWDELGLLAFAYFELAIIAASITILFTSA